MPNRISQSLFVTLQRALPARLLGRAVHAVSRSRNHLVKTALIRGFVRMYGVDVAEAERPVPDGYGTFNEFFTRGLKSGSRPVDPDPAAITSPADGTIQQLGLIRDDMIMQVKGLDYSAAELLGGGQAAAAPYRDGLFVTVYLAPHNYHRVHMPVAGRVVRLTHVPGELWSVNATTAARVPGLFARNERLVCHCRASWGPFAVVFVGALNVGSISTVLADELPPRARRQPSHRDYAATDARAELAKGACLGQFNMGSTVIVLLPADAGSWREDLGAGASVRAGAAIGRLGGGAARS